MASSKSITITSFGTIRAELNLSSNRDIKKFMETAHDNGFKQLSSLSNEYHIHTIEAPDDLICEEIKKELKEKNILID